MSYEGYVQALCKNGHLIHYDCYEGEPKCCFICKEKFVWHNHVDITNGSHYGDTKIDGYKELKIKKQIKCTQCGSIRETIYHIPNGGKK